MRYHEEPIVSNHEEGTYCNEYVNIRFQTKPVKTESDVNGTRIQTILGVLVDRIEYIYKNKNRCQEYEQALIKLKEATFWLNSRHLSIVKTEPKQVNQTSETKERTDLQKGVLAFKLIMGVPEDDKNWDKIHYGRTAKSVKDLLAMTGTIENLVKYMHDFSQEYRKKGLSFTIETMARNYHTWMQEKQHGFGKTYVQRS